MGLDLHLDWDNPLPLSPSANGIYDVDLDRVPEAPGIYVFFRVFGKVTAALYVGKAEILRVRIGQQLNVARLMRGIERAPKGRRYLVCARFRGRPGQRLTCLATIERALIRHYLSKGDELLNVHGNRIRKHSLTSERTALRKFIPKQIYFE